MLYLSARHEMNGSPIQEMPGRLRVTAHRWELALLAGPVVDVSCSSPAKTMKWDIVFLIRAAIIVNRATGVGHQDGCTFGDSIDMTL